jgi:hypothetical protein
MHNKVAATQIKNQLLYGALLEKQANVMKGVNAVLGDGLGVNLGMLGDDLNIEKLKQVADAIDKRKAIKAVLWTNRLAEATDVNNLIRSIVI